MPYENQPELAVLTQIPDRDLADLVDAIKGGAKHPGDAMGFDAPALTAIERMALGYYRARKFDKAAALYAFVLQMNPDWASAWRGLGGCCQSLKDYYRAV